MKLLVNISSAFIDGLIPPSCLLCGIPGVKDLCESCRQDLPWLQTACHHCALPLSVKKSSDGNSSMDKACCALCLHKPPSFDRCVSAFHFANPVGPLINQFKLHHNLRNGRLLSANLVEIVRNNYLNDEKPQAIVPIPLHWRRILGRGFNQATTISQHLGKQLDIPVKTLLKRQIPTPKQQGLNRKQRLGNLKNAFAIKTKVGKIKAVKASAQKYQNTIPNHVALVDDVMTTGATAEAASLVLKQAGIAVVDVWVLARTPSPQ